VRTARASLTALTNDEPSEFEGKLADAIRTVLKAKRRSHVPTEIRDLVKGIGYVFREDSNQMAAVHGVLRRLVDSGYASTKTLKDAPTVIRYFWSGWNIGQGSNALPPETAAAHAHRAKATHDQLIRNRAAAAQVIGTVTIDPTVAPHKDKK
jgi:hypothetical protein